MNHLTGKAVLKGMGIKGIFMQGLSTEIIYSFVIIACSLMIYFGTRELYELSFHKGIKYFRLGFLFFAISYFFRSFIKFVLVYFDVTRILDVSPKLFGMIFGHVTLFLFMYFSGMAIFYLLYSVMHKKWNGKKIIYLFHLLSILIGFLSILFINSFNYLLINLILFLFVLFIVLASYSESKKKSKKKKHNLYFIYLLLLIFWIFNILDILVPNFFRGFQLFIYVVSLGIFLLILYKVLKKAGSG